MIDKMKKTVYDYNISTGSVHLMLEKKHQKMQIVVLDIFFANHRSGQILQIVQHKKFAYFDQGRGSEKLN